MKKANPKMDIVRCSACGELHVIAGGVNNGCPRGCSSHWVTVSTVQVSRNGVLKALREA